MARPSQSNSSVARVVHPENEPELVTAARNGDAAAFTELVGYYDRKIFRLAENITRNREDAEDVMQNAFLKAYENLHRFKGGSRFYTWLVRIAVNEALMKLRKRRGNQFSLDEPVGSDEDLMPRQIADWGPSPEDRYAQEELQRILSAAVASLEDGYRTVFVLRDGEQLSSEETAETLGLSVAAVKSRLLRARLKLREKLSEHFGRKR